MSRKIKYMEPTMSFFFIFGAKYLYIAVIGIASAYLVVQGRDVQRRMIIFAMLVLPLSYLAAKIFGLFLYSPRPFAVEHFTPLIAHAADNGFPSDHTLIVAAISAVVWPFSRKISSALWVLTFIVGVSRVYVGVHHAVDIAGSIAIATASAVLVQFIVGYILAKRTNRASFLANREV